MIELRDIRRYFQMGDQEVRALDAINMRVAAGEYVSIMGPSGSGKSTLLNVLGLLDRPTAGTYVLDDRETTSLSDDELANTRARKIGFIFQSFHLVPRLTAFENVELPLVLAGIAPAERRPRVQQLLESLS
ncbi:MAG: ABC transporter ATP-binding protein, partial [Myxococcota bacterium]